MNVRLCSARYHLLLHWTMAVKPTSLRQLEEQFVCQYRCSGDEEPARLLGLEPRPPRTEPPRKRRLFQLLRR